MSKNYLNIFKNEKANTQIIDRDGKPVSYRGEPYMHPELNGKFELKEALPIGEYNIAIYKRTAKSGLVYYSGKIKPAYKKEDNNSTAEQKPRVAKVAAPYVEPDDDIPF